MMKYPSGTWSLCYYRYITHMRFCQDLTLFFGNSILRIGFYEIVKPEMPPYAVVDENVNLAKFALRPGAGNMVNGILRKLVSLKVHIFLSKEFSCKSRFSQLQGRGPSPKRSWMKFETSGLLTSTIVNYPQCNN
ncbi:uncharacterized protein [Spinacia oleracea]|uniref:Uncharacterized protein isoform X4 n=1 Tax=Spinacia oleracea TaxID=3562 RepID=A0ABM3QGU1_SPIOL|nr:uncharacterized protein LOC110798644 isoform X4 [Spinacia oleracea]